MEQTVEQKLKALYELQTIHSKIDKIRQVRGELPMEVADLEDDVAGLETRIQKIKYELDDLEDEIVTRKNVIRDAQANIKKYETQLNEVKNNREYDAITKEVEIQGLDIQVSEKKIREFGFEITSKNGKILTRNIGTFRGFLESLQVEILEISGEEQRNFATNFLNLGNNKIVAALSSNPRVNAELQQRGIKIHYAELTKLVDGYGAVHCLTAPIGRN